MGNKPKVVGQDAARTKNEKRAVRYRSSPLWKDSDVIYRDRRIRVVMVALQPTCLLLRLKGTRAALSLPYNTAYQMAAKLEANRLMAERKAARAAKRGAL